MSGKRIKVPETVDAAKTQLTELDGTLAKLDGLVTAREWKRAAIVYAFTTEADGPGRPKVNPDLSSPEEFARLGIAGLRSKNTVRKYRNAWQSALDAGKAKEPKPGSQVTLPNIKWPPKKPARDDKPEPGAYAVIQDLDQLCVQFAKKASKLLDQVGELPEDVRRYPLAQSADKAGATLAEIRDYIDNGRAEIPAEPMLELVPT